MNQLGWNIGVGASSFNVIAHTSVEFGMKMVKFHCNIVVQSQMENSQMRRWSPLAGQFGANSLLLHKGTSDQPQGSPSPTKNGVIGLNVGHKGSASLQSSGMK